MEPVMTHHARARMQQRAIPRETIELVLDYGREIHDHHGGVVCFLDKAALRSAERQQGSGGALRRRGRALDAYVVLGPDGTIVTVGHRTKRRLQPWDRVHPAIMPPDFGIISFCD